MAIKDLKIQLRSLYHSLSAVYTLENLKRDFLPLLQKANISPQNIELKVKAQHLLITLRDNIFAYQEIEKDLLYIHSQREEISQLLTTSQVVIQNKIVRDVSEILLVIDHLSKVFKKNKIAATNVHLLKALRKGDFKKVQILLLREQEILDTVTSEINLIAQQEPGLARAFNKKEVSDAAGFAQATKGLARVAAILLFLITLMGCATLESNKPRYSDLPQPQLVEGYPQDVQKKTQEILIQEKRVFGKEDLLNLAEFVKALGPGIITTLQEAGFSISQIATGDRRLHFNVNQLKKFIEAFPNKLVVEEKNNMVY